MTDVLFTGPSIRSHQLGWPWCHQFSPEQTNILCERLVVCLFTFILKRTKSELWRNNPRPKPVRAHICPQSQPLTVSSHCSFRLIQLDLMVRPYSRRCSQQRFLPAAHQFNSAGVFLHCLSQHVELCQYSMCELLFCRLDQSHNTCQRSYFC